MYSNKSTIYDSTISIVVKSAHVMSASLLAEIKYVMVLSVYGKYPFLREKTDLISKSAIKRYIFA